MHNLRTKIARLLGIRKRVLVTVSLSIFLITTLLNLPTSTLGIENRFAQLFNPGVFAEALENQDTSDLLETGFLNPLLPEGIAPDFSINFSCNERYDDSRVIEFYYINRSEYRYDLSKSELRIGSKTIKPFGYSDEAGWETLEQAGAIITHTHYDSKKLIGNAGPIDYMRPGRITAMQIEVPKNVTVVWSVGIKYNNENGERKERRKTTTASTSNLRDCTEAQVSKDALGEDDLQLLQDELQDRIDVQEENELALENEVSAENIKSEDIPVPDTLEESVTVSSEDTEVETISPDDLELSTDEDQIISEPSNGENSESLLTTVSNIVSGFFGGVSTHAQTTTTTTVKLGGLDMFNYCKAQYGDGSILIQDEPLLILANPYDVWSCDGVDIDYDAVCQWQYFTPTAFAVALEFNNPYSLECQYGLGEFLGGLDLYQYCIQSGYEPNELRDNDWVCGSDISIDYNDVCIWQYGVGAYSYVTDIFDPNSIECRRDELVVTDPVIDPIPDPGDPVVTPDPEVLPPDPDDISYLTEEIVADEIFEVYLDSNDATVWDSLKEIPKEFVASIDGYINGDFQLNCFDLQFACETFLDSRLANMIQTIIDFFLGIFEGIATIVTDIVDMVKALWDIRNTVSSLWGMIQQIWNDPSVVLTMLWDQVEQFVQAPISEKLKLLGFVIGEKLKDTLISIFTGGAGLAAAFGSALNKIIDAVKSSSKVAAQGVNAVQKLVGRTLNFGNNIKLKISKSIDGVLSGIKGSDMVQGIKTWTTQQFDEFVEKLPDPVKNRAKELRRDLDLACVLFTPVVATAGDATLLDYASTFVGGVEVEAQSKDGCIVLKGRGMSRAYLDSLDDAALRTLINRYGSPLSKKLDVNHRIAKVAGKEFPEATREALKRLGVENINDTRLLEYMDMGVNRGVDAQTWKKGIAELRKKPYDQVTADDILAIAKQAEINSAHGTVYRAADAIVL